MATDWAADIKKYAPQADDAVIEKLVTTYRLVLSNRDSASVAASDPAELETVRKNFLQGKLGLTQADDVLDAAIKEVVALMKDDRTKSRATVYYLLAQKFNKLDVFM